MRNSAIPFFMIFYDDGDKENMNVAQTLEAETMHTRLKGYDTTISGIIEKEQAALHKLYPEKQEQSVDKVEQQVSTAEIPLFKSEVKQYMDAPLRNQDKHNRPFDASCQVCIQKRGRF